MACEFLFEGNWYTEDELRNVFAQQGKNTQPSKASKDTIKKMKEFLDRIGVDIETVGKIQFNGNTLGINGIAIPLQNLVQVVEGKEDVALTEEAMHMAVELLEQKNPKLFKEMIDRIGRYNLYDKVAAEYQNNPFYQKDGKPNVLKIKKETIGKVLAQTVINKNQDANEKPSMLNQTRTWWQAIIDFLKDLFLRAGFNPFESAATKILEKADIGKMNESSVKPGIEDLFKEFPELASIGSPKLYSTYLDTIFPNSKVKNIVYHGTPHGREDISDKGFNIVEAKDINEKSTLRPGVWFFEDKINAQMYMMDIQTHQASDGSGLVSSLINLEKPLVKDYNFKNFFAITNDSHNINLSSNDGILGYNVEEDVGAGTEYVVYDNSQIHMLGSKSDIEGFRDWINTNEEFYFQVSGPQDLAQKIKEKDVNITKKGDEYEVNGNKVNRTVQKEVKEFYEGRLGSNVADVFFKDFRRETQSKMQIDIKDILSRRVDDDGKIRTTPLEQTNPSAVDPNDNSFYQTLDSHIEQRLSSYEPGTTFLNAPNLYDGRVAGTPDLLAITPTGEVDILQFKSVEASKSGDVKVYVQQAYNTEIEAFRRLLERGYGVKRPNFRMTRAIPIKADYEPVVPGGKEKKLSKLTVGSTNVALIKDESLIPISSTSETTGDKKFDSYIRRLRGLIQTQASERVPPEKRLEKAQRIASLVAAVKKLQITKDATGVLLSAKAVIKAQKEKYKILQTKFSNTDPDVATIKELNKISDDILDDKDQVEIYSDMYQVFKAIFDDGTVASQDIIKEAREISDDARDIADDYLELAVQFRTKKIAAKLTIKDEFNPEKKITWYRRMIRSLSQSTLKAGAELWKLVERINNKFDLEFKERFQELSDIQTRVIEWLEGRDVKELYNKIFQFDEKERWNGRVIQKYSKQFYIDLNKALETKDMKWIRDNIDIDAYNVWMKSEHQKLIDNAKTARVHENDQENARLVQQSLQDFADTFNINFPKGIGTKNDKLKNFPLPKWNSDAYKELEKEENKPLLDLYEYWEKRLKESWESGMFHEYVGKDWFPNVRRGLLEKMTTAKSGGKAATFFSGIRIEAEDQVFGKINPLTGKPVDEVHALYVRDLYQYKEELDGSYFKDYSDKSMDIFKVIGLWDAEILKYQLRTESEAIARLLHYTESNKGILPTTPTGKLLRNKETGEPLEPIKDDTNAKYLKEHMDAVYYGKKRSNEFDVAFNIPYKSVVEKINKLFGREVLTVPEEDSIRVSGTKMIESMNRYFVAKTLGLNLMTSFAQLFGGTTNTIINQGLYFNKKDIAEAEIQYVSNKFWKDDDDKKLAGLIGLIYPFLENRTSQDLRSLSLSGWVKHLSSDHLFFFQRGSDNWVNTIIGMSMIKNTMVHEGKLVNMREFARRELGHADKFAGTYEQSKEFEDRLEARVEELKKSPQSLINYTKIEGDKIVVEGIERSSDTMIQLRQSILEIIKDALGNVSSEDLSLYKRAIVGQSFFMFKNWIPRMADVRFQSLKFQPGTNKYEYGRVRMLWNAVLSKNRSSIGGLLKLLTINNSESLVEVAKKEYERKKADFNKELDELEMSEAEFVDMYIKGVRSEMKEILFAVSLASLLVVARSMEPDDDPEVKGAYRWALRGLDKLTDELTFMYSPASFTSILNGSVFPAVGILVEAQRFFQDVILKLYYKAIGDDEAADRKKVSKHLFRMMPITKELVTYIAIFNNEMAKDYGVKINTNYGSIR